MIFILFGIILLILIVIWSCLIVANRYDYIFESIYSDLLRDEDFGEMEDEKNE